MPWSVVQKNGRWYVRDKMGALTPKGGYASAAEAERYKRALYANAGPEAKRG